MDTLLTQLPSFPAWSLGWEVSHSMYIVAKCADCGVRLTSSITSDSLNLSVPQIPYVYNGGSMYLRQGEAYLNPFYLKHIEQFLASLW